MNDRIPCSAVILTLNSELVLERCLVSIKDFDEIIIVDGNSTDGTRAIAQKFGARIIKQKETNELNIKIDNFTEVRQKGIDAATHNWIVTIDSDEWFSPELVEEIREIVGENNPKVALQAPDIIVLDDGFGKIMKHAWFYPRYSKVRLYSRTGDVKLLIGKKVHERWIVGETAHERFSNNIVYFSLRPFKIQKEKTQFYLALAYEEYKTRTMTFGYYAGSVLFFNTKVVLGILFRVVKNWLFHGFKDTLPFKYTYQTIKYQLGSIVIGTKVLLEQQFGIK